MNICIDSYDPRSPLVHKRIKELKDKVASLKIGDSFEVMRETLKDFPNIKKSDSIVSYHIFHYWVDITLQNDKITNIKENF